MLDYDVEFTFEDGSIEIARVHARSRGAAFATALYSMRSWDDGKEDQIISATIKPPRLSRPKVLGRPK